MEDIDIYNNLTNRINQILSYLNQGYGYRLSPSNATTAEILLDFESSGIADDKIREAIDLNDELHNFIESLSEERYLKIHSSGKQKCKMNTSDVT